jgi:hypothetical protein
VARGLGVIRSVPFVVAVALAAASSCGVDETGELAPHPDAGLDAELGGSGGFTADTGFPDVEDETQPEAAPNDAATGDAIDTNDATDAPSDDATPDAGDDGDVEDATLKCSGAVVGGFCWYAGSVTESCAETCQPHGGCNLAGTRDFAGSGGTDANCVAVLAALGYSQWPHQSFSNNDLGCQFAWSSWTYWSAAKATTCEAKDMGAAAVHRMCACNE